MPKRSIRKPDLTGKVAAENSDYVHPEKQPFAFKYIGRPDPQHRSVPPRRNVSRRFDGFTLPPTADLQSFWDS
jgi:hypothetical protein